MSAQRLKTGIVLGLLLLAYSALFINAYLVNFGEVSYPLFDDGMITLEYAKNLARHGVLSVGGSTSWTAGFTSWVWMLLLSALAALPVSELHLPLLVPLLNVAILFAALTLVSMTSPSFGEGRTSTYYWLLVLTTPSILFWTLRGMEVPLAMLAVAIIGYTASALDRSGPLRMGPLAVLALLSCAIPFIRPELAAPLAAYAVYLLLFGDRPRKWIAFALILLLALGYVGYRELNLAVFGQPATNSYYLKMSGVSSIQKLSRGLLSAQVQLLHNWPYLLVVGALLGFLGYSSLRSGHLRRLRSIHRQVLEYHTVSVLLVIVGAVVLAWMFVGGDAWEELPLLNRFVVVVVPLVSLLASVWAQRSMVVRVALICFVGLNAVNAIKTIGLGAYNDRKFSYIGFSLGKEFGGDVVAMHYWYGQPSYFASVSGGKSIDALGKIDPVVSQSPPLLSFKPGHDRWNHPHTIGTLKPDVIVNMPCPSPHDLKFDCSKVWSEITDTFAYRPHTAPMGEVTIFVSSHRPDLDSKVEELEAELVEFAQKKAKARFSRAWY